MIDKTLKTLYNIFRKVEKQTKEDFNMDKKTVNYTAEMVATIVARYKADPTRETVEALASEFEKQPRSIIAKLSAEGVYVKAPVAGKTKNGLDVVKKEELVAKVTEALGVELPSLAKATKVDLQKLLTLIAK